MIKGEKDKVLTCKLYIVGKAYRQSFLDKHKHANSILDMVVCNLS